MELINVKVIPNAKKTHISEEKGKIKVHVTAPAVKGQANKSLIKILAEFFKVKKSNIKIIKGEKSREKLIEIKDNK